METKKSLRETSKILRRSLDINICKELSRQISNRIINSDCYKNSSNILIYSSIQNEPDLSMVLKDAIEKGKNVYLPKVHGEYMDFYQIESINECYPGMFGILEPYTNKTFDKTDGLVLVPGLLFEKSGKRIGFGKGYYDRYLDKNRFLYKVGICYDRFFHYDWEEDSNDVKMDMVMTETEEVLCDEFIGNM